MKQIDINCDIGESFGHFTIGNDQELFPYISSCNIACGFHGGDPWHMEQAIRQALHHNVQIGAHPGYPDLPGFGRRAMDMPRDELRACIKYQVAALKGMVESLGGHLYYVKPHGALYNTMADNVDVASTVINAIRALDSGLHLMGLAGSLVQNLAEEKNVPFIAEAFADRRYEPNGKLRSRALDKALLEDPDDAAAQVISIVNDHRVTSLEGISVPLEADSICVHGDNPAALNILKAVDQALTQHSIARKSFAE